MTHQRMTLETEDEEQKELLMSLFLLFLQRAAFSSATCLINHLEATIKHMQIWWVSTPT